MTARIAYGPAPACRPTRAPSRHEPIPPTARSLPTPSPSFHRGVGCGGTFVSSLRTSSRALATALALVTTTSAAFAQELRWNLPARGAALYRRTLQVESTQEPTQAWIPGVWFGEPMVAAVMASELAPDRQRLLEPASDPRDLLACIALDLRLPRGGKTRLEVETFDRFFPLQVDVVLGELAADGSQ